MTENANAGAGAEGGTGGQKPWFDGMPAEVVAHMTTHGWDKKTEKEVAIAATQSHFAAQKLIGAPAEEIVRIPKTPDGEGWDKVYEKLGVPKEYKFEGLKRADGKEVDKEFTDYVTDVAKNLHLTQNAATDLAQRLIKQDDARLSAASAADASQKLTDVEALRKLWGPNWDANLFVAQRTATALGVTQPELEAAQKMLGYSKAMEMFRKMGAKIGEDQFVNSTGPGGTQVMTRDMAVNRKQEFMSDKAWVERYTNGGKKELAEMTAVNTIITGSRAA